MEDFSSFWCYFGVICYIIQLLSIGANYCEVSFSLYLKAQLITSWKHQASREVARKVRSGLLRIKCQDTVAQPRIEYFGMITDGGTGLQALALWNTIMYFFRASIPCQQPMNSVCSICIKLCVELLSNLFFFSSNTLIHKLILLKKADSLTCVI